MIEAQGRARRASLAPNGPEEEEPLTILAEERTAYRRLLPELLRDHEGQYVLIKGTESFGVFPDRSQALREGYRRFDVIPFLVRQITASQPVVYLPNVVP
jgi:hypothetical protein